MHSENGKKIYKPYQGIGKWIVFLPWSIPILISTWVAFRMLITGDRNILVMSLLSTMLFVEIIPFCIIGAIAIRISLTLSLNGIEYHGLELQQGTSWLFPFSLEARNIEAKWAEIDEVSWLKEEKGMPIGFTPKPSVSEKGDRKLISIKTKVGNIVFGVMFNSRANEEIMQEILLRSPNLKDKKAHETI